MKKYNLRRLCAAVLLAATVLAAMPAGFAAAFDKALYAQANPLKYEIEIDVTNQVLTVFQRAEDGTLFVARRSVCTTGASATPTPLGSFQLNDMRRRFGYFSEFDCYAQYWVNIVGGIYIHSILYSRPKEGYFTRASYNQLGRRGSHGCIRMLVEDVRWIYYHCPAGTRVRIVKNAANETLRQSLLPQKTYKQYKPTADLFEQQERSRPRAQLMEDAYFTSTAGAKTKVPFGTEVAVLSSGRVTCRVLLGNTEGHINTASLQFLANGVEEEFTVYSLKHGASLYASANSVGAVLGTYAKGSEMVLVGHTQSFYKVYLDGKVGYVLKSAAQSIRVKRDPEAPYPCESVETLEPTDGMDV